jgi:hypothetical protein
MSHASRKARVKLELEFCVVWKHVKDLFRGGAIR